MAFAAGACVSVTSAPAEAAVEALPLQLAASTTAKLDVSLAQPVHYDNWPSQQDLGCPVHNQARQLSVLSDVWARCSPDECSISSNDSRNMYCWND